MTVFVVVLFVYSQGTAVVNASGSCCAEHRNVGVSCLAGQQLFRYGSQLERSVSSKRALLACCHVGTSKGRTDCTK